MNAVPFTGLFVALGGHRNCRLGMNGLITIVVKRRFEMEKLLELVGGENSLLSAYQSMLNGQGHVVEDALTDAYVQHFHSEVAVGLIDPKAIEKFSLADPTIKTVITANTAY
jgi:hypothetical protein